MPAAGTKRATISERLSLLAQERLDRGRAGLVRADMNEQRSLGRMWDHAPCAIPPSSAGEGGKHRA